MWKNDASTFRACIIQQLGKKSQTSCSVDAGKPEDIFTRVNVKGDGNCLFRSLAKFLFCTEERHYEVRQSIVDYAVEHWAEFSDILRSCCEEKCFANAAEHAAFMLRNHELGTDFEVGIAVKNFKLSINIYREYKGNIVLIQKLNHDESSRPLNLLFTGESRSGHWLILQEREKHCTYKILSTFEIVEKIKKLIVLLFL